MQCDFTETAWVVVGTIYTCEAQVSGSSENLSITGNHLTEKSNSDLAGLNIWRQDLPDIPKGIDKFFPNVKAVQVHTSGLKTINSKDLQQFPMLEVLSIYSNFVVSLDGNLFDSTRGLQFISFSENALQHVGRDLLKNLDNLKAANFLENPCVDIYASSSAEISELNDKLPLICPAEETTTVLVPTKECPVTCIEHFGVIEENFSKVVASFEERIVELEKQMRELSGNPCGCPN